MKRVIALVLCIVCMAGVALGDAASYMGGVWLCDEFDWAGIAIIHGRDIYTDEVLAYWFDLRRGG